VNTGRKTVEGWIYVGSDYDSLHDYRQDRSNRDGSVVGEFGRVCDFGNWGYEGTFPLSWDNCGGKR